MSDAADPLFRVVEKARAVAGKVTGLRRVAQDAQIREAVVRAELSAALHDAMLIRSELSARLRAAALAAYTAGMRQQPLRSRAGLNRRLELLLLRLGTFGKAAVIARSGVWTGTGRPLFDLRHMAAYARRGANPAVMPPSMLDQAWYLEQNPDVAAGGDAPLVHYLSAGGYEGRAPRPLFDDPLVSPTQRR
ncbi:hypothetical protein LRS10_21660 [Phenylobacterium sp. J426]|uniref:hypothetical protein n=1 Tax=Phenylobacterium sp. J426 TaxID=2898439 RepID=UPI002151A808|nr:hypothetical protein [Phenylobacterium sp. J426]MCR5876519.1 hypothetical protein [Phenylobacterium sp. J426]